jgi:ABC-2 type transport system permease protein
MSATPTAGYSPADALPAQQDRPAGFGHILLAEWTKIRSVRSTVWSLIIFLVLTVGLTYTFTAIDSHLWNSLPPGRRAVVLADPAGVVLAAGVNFGQLAICVLGVLIMSSEYSTGVIRASLLAVPRRFTMLVAKVIVFGLLVIVIAELAAFASFFIGSAVLHSHVSVSLSDPGVLRAVYGTGLYLTVLGLLALAIGSIVRHTAGGIAIVLGLIIVLEPLSSLLPESWGAHIHAYLPTVAGREITRAPQGGGQLLTAWQGFGVFCLWTVLVLAVAAVFLDKRDA